MGYGINYYLSSKWSVMPGVAVRAKALGHNSQHTGNCASTYIDVPLLAQYHFGGEKRQGIVLELGPVVSFWLIARDILERNGVLTIRIGE